MRMKCWCSSEVDDESNRVSNAIQSKVPAPKGPVLRSSLPYKKVENVDQAYVINMELLVISLEKCQYCSEGPLDLCNITEDRRCLSSFEDNM